MPTGGCPSIAGACFLYSMRNSSRCSLLILGFLAAVGLQAANLRLVPVTAAFGQPMDGCAVRSVQSVKGIRGRPADYSARFQGLFGSDIPPGRYEVEISCNGGEDLRKTVTLARPDQLEVIPRFERIMRSDPPPLLAIFLKSAPPGGGTWWVRIAGIYKGREHSDHFDPNNGAAIIVDPDPGRYLVEIRSTNGYQC